MTNRLLFITLIFSLQICCFGQNNYKWTHSVKKITANEYDLVFKVIIDDGFSIFACSNNQDTGIILPTEIKFVTTNKYVLIGDIKESTPKKINHEMFGSQILVHQNNASFTQRIKVLTRVNFKITASIESEIFNNTQATFPPPKQVIFDIIGQ